MNEQAETHTLLNRPDEALPSPDDGSHDLQEHALSLDAALKSAGSDFLPQMESSHISKKFLDVENERKEQFQPAPENSARPASTAPASTPQSTTGSLIDYDHLISSSEPVQQQQQPSPPTTPMAMPMTTAAPSSQKAQTLQFPPQPSEAGVVQGSRAAWRVETEVEAAVARERDVAAAFSGLPRVRATWKHNYMKILLVGDDGLGKTTFVRNLFAAYAADVNFPVADATGEGSAAVFGEHPERLCTQLSVKDEDEMVYWHYLVQDTPGYGDFDGHEDAEIQRSAILNYVTNCSSTFLEMELDTSRQASMQQVPDSRVDVCLYFLPPHHLRRTDTRFIKSLSTHIPVIPILSKADAMTPEELKEYRHLVRSSLHKTLSSPSAWHFSRHALEAAGAQSGPPFAVICAATIDRSVGRFWPVRKYPWGRCESLLTAHSELPAVRRLLFETGYWELKAHTDKRYLKFRKEECADRVNPLPRPIRSAMRLAWRAAATVGAIFLVVNAGPLVRSEIVRQEASRRVKAKVGEAVEGAIDTAYSVQERAEEAVKVAKSTAGAAVESGKRTAAKAASSLETPQVKELREAAERKAMKKPWWRILL